MFESFNNYLNQIVDKPQNATFLLAVSGGIDSMCMLELFRQSSFSFAVANINYNLRGQESLFEHQFVADFCNKFKIQIFQKTFDTKTLAEVQKIGIQELARKLRYEWFDEMRREGSFDFIATAHHLDDQAETMLFNLARGTGIAGLHGIKARRGYIIRPLMFADRAQIQSFVESCNIPFCNDSSNQSIKYSRNYIRHNVLSALKVRNPKVSFQMNRSANLISEWEDYTQAKLREEVIEWILPSDQLMKISLEKVTQSNHKSLVLFFLLQHYGFQHSHIDNLIELLSQHKTGTKVQSATHQIIIERSYLQLELLQKPRMPDVFLHSFSDLQIFDFTVEDCNELNIHNTDPNIAYLNADLLVFPLKLGPWQQGDRFFPLGMNGSKLLSDFYVDLKLSQQKKEAQLLLKSNDEIVWIVGRRIDQRFSIQSNNQKIIKLTYHGHRKKS